MKNAVDRDSRESELRFTGNRFFMHESGAFAVGASVWDKTMFDVVPDEHGRLQDAICTKHNCIAGAWVRCGSNPETGQVSWVQYSAKDIKEGRAENLSADAASIALALDSGNLPERLPEGWHEVSELDFERDKVIASARYSGSKVKAAGAAAAA